MRPLRSSYVGGDGKQHDVLIYSIAAAHKRPSPLILNLHGGAWSSSSADSGAVWCEPLAEAGFVVASPDFTSSLDAPWPAGFEDTRCAAAWLRERASSFGADERWLAVLGDSSGGHYATMLGLRGDSRGRRPEAVVGLWPIVDVLGRFELVAGHAEGTLTRFLADRMEARRQHGRATNRTQRANAGAIPRADARAGRGRARLLSGELRQRIQVLKSLYPPYRAERYRRLARAHLVTFPGGRTAMRAASPIEAVEVAQGDLPPLLLLHAEWDINTSLEMSERLVRAWRRRDGEAELALCANVGHGFGTIESWSTDDLVYRIHAFLHRRGAGEYLGPVRSDRPSPSRLWGYRGRGRSDGQVV